MKWFRFTRIFFITLVIVTVIGVQAAQAKVISFIAGNVDGDLYEYEYRELMESYALSLMGMSAPLYQDYSERNVQLVFDDVNSYVDYNDVLEAYAIAIMTGKPFDLDAYTSGPNAKVVAVERVNLVTVENGKLKFTEKVIVDPVELALEQVNGAADTQALKAALEGNASILGLSLGEYNKLSDFGKFAAVDAVRQLRGDGFADAKVLKTVFDEEVEKALSSVEHVLGTVNAATGLAELEQLLLNNGDILGLELDAYSLIINSRRGNVLSQVFEALPFAAGESLKQKFNDSVAATLRSYVIVSYTGYDLTISEMVNIQMGLSAKPQWHVSGQGWRNAPAEEVEKFVNPANFVVADLASKVSEIIVAASTLRVRETPSTNSAQMGTVTSGKIFEVKDVTAVWENTSVDSKGYWFKIDTGDFVGWVSGNYVDWVADEYSAPMFQFLNLSGPSGATMGDLAKILNGRGILSGTEEAFYQAARENNINEIFLTSLALHETGNGSSTLANGQLYEGKMVYNMFGIGAIDSNPNFHGAKYAFEQEWFTPEAAIIGGARFASRNYVNHSTYRQDTLYKMRWNPGRPGVHQYATDVGWANKQTSFIRQLYQQVNMFNLRFDIPRYKFEE